MKQILLFAILTIASFSYSQLNTNFLGQLDLVDSHNSDGNDIWGYVDGSGEEYAIMGLNDGTSIVNVTDPTNPVEVFYEPGLNSIWRDIKTWDTYAFITTEADNGLLIIDMSGLNGTTNVNLTTTYYTNAGVNEWESAHNLYIDENGVCYIFGANRGNKGCIMLDVTDPSNIQELGDIDNYYVHDGVCKGDTLYLAHIEDGFMTIWDVSSKSSPVFLGQANTPGNFAHNIWFSDDLEYVYTTDEISNGYIGEYNVSDPSNIYETDRIQSNPGNNVIPHNSHFINDYVVTSYYRDGVTIHDVSNKGNMVEVGNFDTSPLAGDGFNGCWGAYPWLPSGNILLSDIETGLYIIGATYTRACFLEGNVINASTTAPINAVTVEVLNTPVNDLTNIVGDYALGYHTAGNYNVVYSNPGYISDTIFNLTLTSGATVTQDVQLVPLVPTDISINVQSLFDLSNLAGVEVTLTGDLSYSGTTDANGEVVITGVIPGDYIVTSGIWGHNTKCQNYNLTQTSNSISFGLEKGYMDDFTFDFGWTIISDAASGTWERADPLGVDYGGGTFIAPEEDVNGDCGDQCYVTGNSSSGVGADDVDGGYTMFTSQSMDLTDNNDPYIHFERYWINFGGSGNPNDSLIVFLNDGIDLFETAIYLDNDTETEWLSDSVRIKDYTSILTAIEVTFYTADRNPGHLVEAAIDDFKIIDNSPSVNVVESNFEFNLFPNPTNGDLFLERNSSSKIEITVMNLLGEIQSTTVSLSTKTKVSMPATSGIYLIKMKLEDGSSITKKIIRN